MKNKSKKGIKTMEELTKAIINLQSYGLNLRTIEKMVKDIYKSAEEAKYAGIRRD